MELNEYQAAALKHADYPNMGANMLYPALGLAGEAGEAVDKVKKLWRNQGITSGTQLNLETKQALGKELGDILWYIAAQAREIGYTLNEIGQINIDKLNDRHDRGVIKSEGDER